MSRRRPYLSVRSLSLLPSCCLAAACGSDAARVTPASVRDSAGVAIVESARPAWAAGAGWRVDSVPALALGEADGPPERVFHRVNGVRLLADGHVAVASEGHRQVRLYDGSGRLVRSWGRDGEGPGEYVSLELLSAGPGDTLVTWDFIAGRMSLLPARGGASRFVTLPRGEGGATGLWLAGRLAGGATVLRSAVAPPPGAASGMTRDSVAFFLAGGDGSAPVPLARVAGKPSFQVADERGVTGYAVPFTADAQVAVAGDSVFLGAGDSLDVRVYGPAGLRRVIRAPVRGGEVAPRETAAFAEELRRAAPPGSPARRRIDTFLENVVMPSTRPAHGRLMVADDGALWARVPAAAGTPERWNVFDAGGTWLGEVAMPPGFAAADVRGGRVAGVHTDADGIERVWELRLVR